MASVPDPTRVSPVYVFAPMNRVNPGPVVRTFTTPPSSAMTVPMVKYCAVAGLASVPWLCRNKVPPDPMPAVSVPPVGAKTNELLPSGSRTPPEAIRSVLPPPMSITAAPFGPSTVLPSAP